MKQNEIKAENGIPSTDTGEIILYQPDSSIRLEVRMQEETVWLNRPQIAMLFDRDIKTIGKHINNALHEELSNSSVVAKFATTARDGKIYQVEHYNIDNYVDDSVLKTLTKRDDGICASIVTRKVSDALAVDLARHNQQYPPIEISTSDRFHDRFLIIDETVYHLGASLKDLGKKLFAFTRMEVTAEVILHLADVIDG